MADRITLNFGANTSDVEQGTDRIADGLDAVDRKLEEVGSSGEKAGDAAADGLSSAGDAAGDVGDKLGDLGGVATDVLEGDLAGGAKGAVDALSGLAAFIPGVGALIGAGLATVASGFIDSWSEAAKANEDRINAMYEDFTQSGDDFLSNKAISDEISRIIQDAEDLQTARDDAATTGARLALILRAQAGDQTAINSVQQIATQTLADLQAEQENYIATNGDVSASLDEQIGGLEEVIGYYQNYGEQQDSAVDKAKLFREATENAGTAVGNLNDDLNAVPDSIFASVEVDTGTAQKKLDTFVASLRGRRIPIVADVVDRYGRSLD